MIEKINQLKKENIPLFYITEGNPKAFKLFVRHISYAETLGLGKIIENTFVPNTTIYIVNFEKEEITKTKKPFSFKSLKYF